MLSGEADTVKIDVVKEMDGEEASELAGGAGIRRALGRCPKWPSRWCPPWPSRWCPPWPTRWSPGLETGCNRWRGFQGRWIPALLLATFICLVVGLALGTAIVFLPSMAGSRDPTTGGSYAILKERSMGPSRAVDNECNAGRVAVGQTFHIGDEYCTYIVDDDAKKLVDEAEAISRCRALNGDLPYFDTVEEECAVMRYARRHLILNDTSVQRHYWLNRFQYVHDERSGRLAIAWGNHRTPNYPMRVCHGQELHQPGHVAWTMDLSLKTESHSSCWHSLHPEDKAWMMCKICSPLSLKGPVLAVTWDDLERRHRLGWSYRAQSPRSACSGAEHTIKNAHSGDRFFERPEQEDERYLDGFQPGCRYYALLARTYTYSEAVAQCASLNSDLLWFDNVREECQLLNAISGWQDANQTWIRDVKWGRYSHSQVPAEYVLMYPDSNVPYVPRMCHPEDMVRPSATAYRPTLHYGSRSQECWERVDPKLPMNLICKRCNLPQIT